MLQTWLDCFRIPWRGGAKEVSLEAIIPALLLPISFVTAALNQYIAGLITLLMAVFLLGSHYRTQQLQVRTRFYCMWLIWSLIYMIIVFENTVPLLEVLPEENCLLIVLSCVSLYFLWRTRNRAALNQVLQKNKASSTTEELPEIVEEEEVALTGACVVQDIETGSVTTQQQQTICSTCRKYVPIRTAHCSLCGACILRHDHHSYWLDCCIGKANHCSYFLGMLFGTSALLLGANFILTAVCHPLLVQRVFDVPLMLPDDCSQVFDEFQFSLSFVIAIYAIGMAFYIKASIVQQVYLVSIGLTMDERRRGQERSHRSIWTNWKNLLLD